MSQFANPCRALGLAAALLLAVEPVLGDGGRDHFQGTVVGEAAQHTEMGLRYLHGEGVARDVDAGVRLLCAAARHGHAPAQYELGWIYANARGVERDDALAAAWFRLAAEAGDAHARRMLERMDDDGKQGPALCVSPAGVQPFLSSATPTRQEVEEVVRHMAPARGLDPALVLALIDAESAFDARARSPKGALGLMQLIPATAERFGVAEPLDPAQNLEGGMAYLRWLLERYGGSVRLALAGYNAGEHAVDRYGDVPPYAETRAYVARITRRYSQPYHPLKDAILFAAVDDEARQLTN